MLRINNWKLPYLVVFSITSLQIGDVNHIVCHYYGGKQPDFLCLQCHEPSGALEGMAGMQDKASGAILKGTYYAQAREYCAELGRFAGEDVISGEKPLVKKYVSAALGGA